MSTHLEMAMQYARAGYAVLPLRGKIPRTEHGAHDATTDESIITAWWIKWPHANIGITLAGLVVVDIDPRNGGSVDLLPHPLPATCIAETGGGGLHYVYRVDPRASYRGKLAAGVDQKTGPGSYIVVAPSLHDSGRMYRWLPGASLLDTAPIAAPDWLAHRIARQDRARPASTAPRRRKSKLPWIELGENEIAPGVFL